MPTDEEWTDLEHLVDRHETAVNDDAATIAQLQREIALITEALEKLDLYKFQGMENATVGEAARDRFREIVKQLKAGREPKN